MKTVVYVAHPDVQSSQSQQFLIESGKALTEVDYVDLYAEWQREGKFDKHVERERLAQYDRIFFQFPLYWYQAPAVLKEWIDTVFSPSQSFHQSLGLIVIAGVRQSAYQAGEKEQRTLSELLSPYESLARYFNMRYLPTLAVHQFQYMTESQKMTLMIDYAVYLTSGTVDCFEEREAFLIQQLYQMPKNMLDLDGENRLLFDIFKVGLEAQAEEWRELDKMMQDW